jgi:hypothetical protein
MTATEAQVMADTIEAHDSRERYCPMLGRRLPFSYWRGTFDVEQFLRHQLTDPQVPRIAAPRSEKAAILVELIAKATGAQPEHA